jgi:hypothetical protein
MLEREEGLHNSAFALLPWIVFRRCGLVHAPVAVTFFLKLALGVALLLSG